MHDQPDELSGELQAVFARLQERYTTSTPPPVAPGLSAYLGVDLTNDNGDLSATAASNANEPAPQVVGLPNWRASTTRGRQRIMQPIAAFIGTAVGKLVLGTTVAAASVGAGHATGVIDVTPSSDPPPAVVDDEHEEELEVDEDGVEFESETDTDGVETEVEIEVEDGDDESDGDEGADGEDESDDDADDADEEADTDDDSDDDDSDDEVDTDDDEAVEVEDADEVESDDE